MIYARVFPDIWEGLRGLESFQFLYDTRLLWIELRGVGHGFEELTIIVCVVIIHRSPRPRPSALCLRFTHGACRTILDQRGQCENNFFLFFFESDFGRADTSILGLI